jgi:hypothetical protein
MDKSLGRTILRRNKGPQVRSFQEITKPKRVDLISMAEKIANDKLCYRNYVYPGSKNLFPDSPKLQTVDKFYPYAEGGPLFVDEWANTDLKETIETKRNAMRKLGHRYLSVTPGMTELEAIESLA